MKKRINLFEILGDKGAYGLIDYLKSIDETTLKLLSSQYSVEKSVKTRDDIIKGILTTIENTMNIGYVFTQGQSKLNLVDLYK